MKKTRMTNKKVAAYCRVSTSYKEQEGSFELQKNYYHGLIHGNTKWEFAGIYADYGKSGTQTRGRTGFYHMIRDCKEGKIDKIICKSISRFARNTVDLLEMVKVIKENGISVFFEKENIDTQWKYDELLLTIYAAMAQEESRNISENIRWAYQKRFQQGIPALQPLYGYICIKGDRQNQMNIQIEEKEGKIVRKIFSYADKGYGYTKIARILNQKKIPYKEGKAEWTMERIRRILQNERYAGNVICQKYYVYDYLTHKKKENKGEVKQYKLRGFHPAIVEEELFQRVQKANFLGKKPGKKKEKTTYLFSSRLICGNCGSNYQTYNRKKEPRWRCGRAIRRLGLCEMSSVREQEIEAAVKEAFMERYYLYDIKNMDILKNSLFHQRSIESLERDWEFLNQMESQMAVQDQLEYINSYKKIIENDSSNRTQVINWLQSLASTRKGREQFLSQMITKYMDAWIIHICICEEGYFRFHWFDNVVTKISREKKGGNCYE